MAKDDQTNILSPVWQCRRQIQPVSRNATTAVIQPVVAGVEVCWRTRATNIVLTNLQEGDAGLEPGSLYTIGNRLFISKLNIAHPLGVSAATSVGSVTVVIS